MDYISSSFFFATFLQNIWFVHHNFFPKFIWQWVWSVHVQTAFKFSMSQQKISNIIRKNTFSTWLSFNFKRWASQRRNAFLLSWSFTTFFLVQPINAMSDATNSPGIATPQSILPCQKPQQKASWEEADREVPGWTISRNGLAEEDRELWRSLTAQASAMTPWVSEWELMQTTTF